MIFRKKPSKYKMLKYQVLKLLYESSGMEYEKLHRTLGVSHIILLRVIRSLYASKDIRKDNKTYKINYPKGYKKMKYYERKFKLH